MFVWNFVSSFLQDGWNRYKRRKCSDDLWLLILMTLRKAHLGISLVVQ